MQSQTYLQELRRPKILIRAARMGLETRYGQTLVRRLIGGKRAEDFATLAAREQALESDRRAGAAAYRVEDHVRALTELILEAMQRPESDGHPG